MPLGRWNITRCGCDCSNSCEVPIHVSDFCTAVDSAGVVSTWSQAGTTVAVSAPTDAWGSSSVTVPAGTYDVATTKEGCTSIKTTIAVTCPSPPTADLKIWCGTVWHKVCVTATCSGKGAGINVSITYADGNSTSGVTDGDGCFSFRPTATGTATVVLNGTSGKHTPSTSTINITSLCTPTSYAKTITLISPWTCCFDGTRTWIVKPGVMVTIGAMSGYAADATICTGSICLTGPAAYVADQPALVSCVGGGTAREKPVQHNGTTRCIVVWGDSAGHATQQVPHACYTTFDTVPVCSGAPFAQLCRSPLTCAQTTSSDRSITATSMVVDGNGGTCTITFPDDYPTSYDPGGTCPGTSRPISTTCLITQV